MISGFWNQISWALIFFPPVAHLTLYLFFFNWKTFPNYFAIKLFWLGFLFLLSSLQLPTTSSHFFCCSVQDLTHQERCEFGPRCLFFPCKSWCLCREACGHLGISLKGIALQQVNHAFLCHTTESLNTSHICHCLWNTCLLQSQKTISYIFMQSWEPKGFWLDLLHLKHFVMGCSQFWLMKWDLMEIVIISV